MSSSAFEHTDHKHIGGFNLDLDAYVHAATGARHFHFSCDDDNNAFMVAFPTLPSDASGVAHILEHTALCGSRRYPVRDPFFMMLRRSLNTFMNAFTSGDSTAYPFATQNRKDFDNLLAVYLDAVFFPTLDPLDFAQEGWRLDFVAPGDDSELVFKGVVYNEMKGAMSAPSTQLWQQLHAAIFPDTVYHFNSGGDPASIPNLSFDQLTAFHRTHYHPSHAIFMTYGSFCVREHQDQFESLVLKDFVRCEEELQWKLQPRFKSFVENDGVYAVAHSSELRRGTHVVWGWLLGETSDPVALLEGHLLAGLLLEHGASPLRHYLETTSLADAPSELCGIDDSCRELVFCCGVEGSDPEHVDQLTEDIVHLLQKIADEGVDQETLVGVLDRMEIAQRDIGAGGYPYGLQLMGRALPGALYGSDPAGLIDIDGVLRRLRTQIGDRMYIASLVGERLLNNPHRVCAVMRPDEHKFERDSAAEAARLAETLQRMDAPARAEIRARSSRLEARQDEPQNADLLPKVTLADVPRALPEIAGAEVPIGDSSAHRYAATTNGLVYLQLVFDLPAVDDSELRQLPLFCEYLTELGAGGENYLQTQARRALAGNIGVYSSARTDLGDVNRVNGRLVVTAKGLARKKDDLIFNLFEVLNAVGFDEYPRLVDLLSQSRVDVEASITDRGHQLAMQGAARSLSAGAFLDDLWEGPANIAFVQSTDRLCQDSAEEIEPIARSFEQIRIKLLSAPWRVLVVGEEGILSEVIAGLGTIGSTQRVSGEFTPFAVTRSDARPNVAWMTNTQVNFCAKAYPAVTEGHSDAAAMSVLAKFLTDGYLHPAIREKGGAYGAGAQFDVGSATFRFFSYRDPRLAGTLEDFDRSLDWLSTTNDAQRLEESILGVIRNLDNPRSPAGTAIHAFFAELDGRSHAFRTAYRDAVLNTTAADVQAVAQRYLKAERMATAVVTHAGHKSEVERLHLHEERL